MGATAVASGEVGNYDGPGADHMRTCLRCGVRYDWRKSTSGSLKMTFCGTLCEIGSNGLTIEALLAAQRSGSG